MAVLHSFGNLLVPQDEFITKSLSGTLIRAKNGDSTMNFRNGNVSMRDFESSLAAFKPGYVQSGLGKPLTIEILSYYTGNIPNKGWLGIGRKKPEMLLTSAIKSYTESQRAPRALNQLVKNVDDHEIRQPAARDEGSPIMYYTKAIDQRLTQTTIEMAVNTINQNILETLGNLLGKAAMVPLFFSASPYLLVGAQAVKIAGNVLEAILETKPVLREDLNISFGHPAFPDTAAQNYLICNDNDSDELSAYSIELVGKNGRTEYQLRHKQTKTAYNGDSPYIIIGIDGNKRTDLETFKTQLATAQLIEDFHGPQNMSQKIKQNVEKAIALVNDSSYHHKALRKAIELDELDPASEEYQQALSFYKAYYENITDEVFKVQLKAPDEFIIEPKPVTE